MNAFNKITWIALLSLLFFTACNSSNSSSESEDSQEASTVDVAYKIAENYFIKNDVENTVPVKIVSQEEFDHYFGMATTMGAEGKPTEIDFSQEFVIVADQKETDIKTEIVPVSLEKVDGQLSFNFNVLKGEEQSFTSRPFLMIIVSKSEEGEVVLSPNEGPLFADEHNSYNSLDWNGTYEGVLPCADCEGIKTTVILETDGKFTVNAEYLGKESALMDMEGEMEWSDDGNRIVLATEDEKMLFQVQEGSLLMLDQEGNVITGELADAYLLEKIK